MSRPGNQVAVRRPIPLHRTDTSDPQHDLSTQVPGAAFVECRRRILEPVGTPNRNAQPSVSDESEDVAQRAWTVRASSAGVSANTRIDGVERDQSEDALGTAGQ